jgi:spore germination cell wall hydrolase CwlJ-like protein
LDILVTAAPIALFVICLFVYGMEPVGAVYRQETQAQIANQTQITPQAVASTVKEITASTLPARKTWRTDYIQVNISARKTWSAFKAENELTQDEINLSDVEALARTLAGECYDNQPEDKKRVCWVVLSRVDDPRYPNTIIEVLSAPGQFEGFNLQHREVSDNDREIAAEIINAWSVGDYSTRETKPNGKAFLMFSSGDKSDQVNSFR